MLGKIIPADGLIYAMPLYFYGMPGRLKTVFDRLFCYTSNSAPQQNEVVTGIVGKRVGVLISSEESYQGATLGVVAQFQELTRYLNQELAGVVVGNANSRGEIVHDPRDAVMQARMLGANLFNSQSHRLPARHASFQQGLGNNSFGLRHIAAERGLEELRGRRRHVVEKRVHHRHQDLRLP